MCDRVRLSSIESSIRVNRQDFFVHSLAIPPPLGGLDARP